MNLEGHTTSLCALAGLTGFVFGAYFQHEVTLRNLICLVRTDPYAYQNRWKLYSVLSLFKGDIEDRLVIRNKKKIGEKLRDLLMSPLYTAFSFFFIVKDARMNGPNLLDIMKYGFPSSGDICIYNEYVVSYDRRTKLAQWVCEHLSKNNINLSESNNPDAVDFHFNDVFVLSNNPLSKIEYFKNQVWHQLETYICRLIEKFDSVYAYTGPLYLPTCRSGQWSLEYEIIEWIPVPIPSHYFKILIIDSLLSESCPYMQGYIVPNKIICEENDLSTYISSIEDIERYSGLKFVRGLYENYNYSYINSLPVKKEQYEEFRQKLASIQFPSENFGM